MIKRIGFACKHSFVNASGVVVTTPEMNFKTTTLAWLNRQTKDVAEQRLYDIVKHNVNSLSNLIKQIATYSSDMSMVRIGSDMLPAYTANGWRNFYKDATLIRYLETELRSIGDYAKSRDIRLSMHPGQFCCLASENPNVVQNSIEEFEYHADIARWMGYGRQFQDMKINIHLSGKLGASGFRESYSQLSTEARNCITVENEENTHGLDACLVISDIVPIVLDVHHHWCREGEWIESSDSRIQKVIDSWCGVRPTIHYSQSRRDILVDQCVNALPDHAGLIRSGIKRQQLRAHSDDMWNHAINRWALQHFDWADVMFECKHKNLAVDSFRRAYIV